MTRIVTPMLIELTDTFIDGVSQNLKNANTLRLTLLIVYLALIIILTFFVWQPFLFYLDRIDKKSKKLMLMLPLELIFKLNGIYKYIEKEILRSQQR